MCHLLNIVSINDSCQPESPEFNTTTVTDNSTMPCDRLELTPEEFSSLTQTPQVLNFFFAFLYFVGISLSFISRGHQLWHRHPGHNLTWLFTISGLFVFFILYLLGALLSIETLFWGPVSLWVMWPLGFVIVILINEVVKRQEIKVEVRHQKRERLEFGTKLGMNSPF